MAKEGTVGERLAKFLAECRDGATEVPPGSVPGGEVIDLERTAFKWGGQYFALSHVRRIPDYETFALGSPGELDDRVRGAVSKVIARALAEYACHLAHYSETAADGDGGCHHVTLTLACRFPEKAAPLLEQAHQWLKVDGAKRTIVHHLSSVVGEGGGVEVEIEW